LLIAPTTFLILLEFSLWTYLIPLAQTHPSLLNGTQILTQDLLIGPVVATDSAGFVALSILSYIVGFLLVGAWAYRLRVLAMFFMSGALVITSFLVVVWLALSLDTGIWTIVILLTAAGFTYVIHSLAGKKASSLSSEKT
jgi:hypothetical protein